jgi:small-conductance mechanosensitive channel
VLGGALAVGLGFGLQKIAANYVSGFVILAERSVRIGDMVKVDNFEGRVSDIRTRYTVIRALNGREAILPNETLITTRVENSSLADRCVLVQATVPVAYGTDLRTVMPALQAAAAAVPGSSPRRRRACSSRTSRPRAWSSRSTSGSAIRRRGQGNVKSEVNLAVLGRPARAGRRLPSAQRTVLAMVPQERAAPAASARRAAAGAVAADPSAPEGSETASRRPRGRLAHSRA